MIRPPGIYDGWLMIHVKSYYYNEQQNCKISHLFRGIKPCIPSPPIKKRPLSSQDLISQPKHGHTILFLALNITVEINENIMFLHTNRFCNKLICVVIILFSFSEGIKVYHTKTATIALVYFFVLSWKTTFKTIF